MATQQKARSILIALVLFTGLAGEAGAAENKLYYSTGHSGGIIRETNLDGSAVVDVLTGQPAVTMDVDPIGGKAYWTASVGGGQFVMRRANLDGTSVEDVWSSNSYGWFRIEPANGKIYYTINNANHVWRANLDGSGAEVLLQRLSASPQVAPRGFAFDVVHDRLYWTQQSGSPNAIQYTNLAATDAVVTVLTDGNGGAPNGIDVDLKRNHVYWKDFKGIWRADLDLGNQTLIVPPPEGQGASGGLNNLRVDAVNDYLYWSQQDTGKVFRCRIGACVPEQIGQLNDTRNLALVLPCYDPFFVDTDTDGANDICDNCVAIYNPVQADLDGDGQGNVCDTDDGRITLWFDNPSPLALLTWDPEFGPDWNIYRGDMATLATMGIYSQVPGSHPSAQQFCGQTVNSLIDGFAPESGEAAFYLGTGEDLGLETDLSTDSAGTQRPHTNPCP